LLAYVFLHVPRPGSVAREYESAHGAFHGALRAAGVRGLHGVHSFKLDSIPWLGGQAGYEDWHLLEGSAALDMLDRTAVSEARRVLHDRIAAMAGSGTAGLYGLRLGKATAPAMAFWLSKPDGMSYAAFESSLKPLVDTGCTLWGRRMTLGPTPEFCLHAPAKCALPYPAMAISLSPVASPSP
jgi:hypothetical protein